MVKIWVLELSQKSFLKKVSNGIMVQERAPKRARSGGVSNNEQRSHTPLQSDSFGQCGMSSDRSIFVYECTQAAHASLYIPGIVEQGYLFVCVRVYSVIQIDEAQSLKRVRRVELLAACHSVVLPT